MINVKIDASLFGDNGLTTDYDRFYHPIWTTQEIVDDQWYEPSFSFENQDQINAFLDGSSDASRALENDPNVITSTRVVWGSDTTGVIVSGASLSGISNIDQLKRALEGGTGQGQFNTITVMEAGEAVLVLELDEQGVAVTSGGQSFEISGALPQTFQNIFDFVEHLSSLNSLGSMTGTEQNALETFMRDYSITEFALIDNGDTKFSISLSESKVELMIEGASIALTGAFPLGNLGNLVNTLYALATKDDGIQTLGEFNALPGVNLTGLSVVNDADTEILSISEAENSSSFEVIGTDNWDSDIEITPFEDDEGNLVSGAYSLGKGEDVVILDVDDVIWGDMSFQNVATIDGGEDFDTLIIDGWDLWDWSQSNENGELTYIGPNIVSINFESGEVSLERDQELLASMAVTNFEALSINLPTFDFIGSAANDRLYIELETDYFSFNGGAGIDQLVLKYTNYEISSYEWIEGVTFDYFMDTFDFEIDDNNAIKLFDADRNLVADISNVEEIRFSDGQGGDDTRSVNEIFGLSDSIGTSGDDDLRGNNEANEISGLDGDDSIFGNGGADTLLGGDGNDHIYTRGPGATVDGGAGWNRLGITDYSDESESEVQKSLIISTNGNSGTVEFTDAEVVTGSTGFANIDSFILDTDRNVVLNGSDEDDRIYVRNLNSLEFSGGVGIDRIDLRNASVDEDADGYTSFTRAYFEENMFTEQTDSGEILVRQENSGELVSRLTDVEEILFANTTKEGELVSVSELVASSSGGLTEVLETARSEEVVLSGGNDTLTGSSGNDTIDGGAGNDVVDLGDGDDVVDSGEGNDSVNGGAGNDQIFDATGDDTINGGAGADQGVSLSGNNTFEDEEAATPPEETISIDDFYCGGYGNDIFRSGDGNDIIIGDVGSEYYFGDDVLLGGRGNDILQAGYGADTFEFRAGDGNDIVGRVDLDALFSSWPNDISDVQMLDMADFEIGIDTIKLINFGSVLDTASFQAALGNGAMSISNNLDGDAVFDSGSGSITFIGIDASDLTVDHFEF